MPFDGGSSSFTTVYELFRIFRAPKIIQMSEWENVMNVYGNVCIARKKIEMTRRFLPRQVQQSHKFLYVLVIKA